jgi:hypothetical protein
VPTLGGTPEIIISPVFDEEGFDSEEEASLRMPVTAQHSKECFVNGGVPHPRNLISYPLYRQMSADVAVEGPLQGRTDARRNLNAEVLREAQQRRRLVPRASSRHAIHLQPRMVTMRSRQLLFFAGRDEGARDLIVLEGEDTGDLFPNTV